MQALIAALVIYAVTFCVIFLVQLGMPSRYPDRSVARFLVANAASDLSTLAVALLIVLGLARGDVAGSLFVVALLVQGSFYTYRVRISRGMIKKKLPKARRSMMVKVSPEVIRITLAVTAGLQLFASMLTGTDILPGSALVVIVALSAALQAMCAAYGQGVQTNPPTGMLTEERAKELDAPTPGAVEPAAYETGRAPIPFVPAGPDRSA
jgi:uncharacterized membrane protein YciS (DUF1049 family)